MKIDQEIEKAKKLLQVYRQTSIGLVDNPHYSEFCKAFYRNQIREQGDKVEALEELRYKTFLKKTLKNARELSSSIRIQPNSLISVEYNSLSKMFSVAAKDHELFETHSIQKVIQHTGWLLHFEGCKAQYSL